MNTVGYNVTVLKDANRVVGSSETNWKGVREGSLIRFDEEPVWYTIASIEEIFLIKEFKVVSSKEVSIRDGAKTLIFVGDSVEISYKESELLALNKIVNGGQGYSIGDILRVKNGTPSLNVRDNLKLETSFEVLEVEDGAIRKVSVLNKGLYISVPEEEAEISGGSGEGAKFALVYRTSENRTIVERIIESIETSNDSILTLNYPLPEGVSSGKLSIKKPEMTLSSNYGGESKYNAKFEILRDFTPNLNLPLLVKNSVGTDKIFNIAMQILDKRISELEKKI